LANCTTSGFWDCESQDQVLSFVLDEREQEVIEILKEGFTFEDE